MVDRKMFVAAGITSLFVILLLGSCDFLLMTPFPSFLSGTEGVLDLAKVAEYNAIEGRHDPGTRYDLAVVENGPAMLLLLKVEPPPVLTPTDYAYRGRIIVFDEFLNVKGVIAPQSDSDYLSRPYSYGYDPLEILIGYQIYNVSDFSPATVSSIDPPHGLTGFAITNSGIPSLHLFATPSGQFSGFNLEIRNYQAPWGISSGVTSLVIIPPGEWPDPASEDFTRLGYQLLGIDYQETPSDQITFLLSRPSEQQVVAVRATLQDIGTGTTTELLSSASDTGLFRLDGIDRPGAWVDADGFFLMQRDGWLVRYQWDGTVKAGNRVVGDTSFDRRYAFYTNGNTFYRFDPTSETITKIKGWWK